MIILLYKNLNKFLKKCPKHLFLANLATLHIPYVTNTPANIYNNSNSIININNNIIMYDKNTNADRRFFPELYNFLIIQVHTQFYVNYYYCCIFGI